jgi:dTDP-glucose 4,6-dehydratase
MREAGWAPQVDFDDGLARTVDWYRGHAAWVARVRSGEYLTYYARNYENRDELRTVTDARSD